MRHATTNKKSIAQSVLVGIALLVCTNAYSQVSIHKKWVIGNESDGLTLLDLSRTDTLVRANSPSDEDVRESKGTNKKGVFYLDSKEAYRVVPSNSTAGDIELKMKDGNYTLGMAYTGLAKDNVTFIFEGEYEWEAHVDNGISVVNPNTLELNISDISKVFNSRQYDEMAMEDLCKGKDMKRIALQKSEVDGVVEMWGRGLSLEGKDVVRDGDGEGLGIIYRNNPRKYIEVCIIFTDKNLLKEYETQLARNWCFPRQTREVSGKKAVTYADKYWVKESTDPTYTLYDDHKGLYAISYLYMSE